MLDERWIRSLHVQSLRRRELHPEHEDHVVFQASTIGALLDGAYEGDLSVAELAEHGDQGLGTLNGLDGEMIVLDGEFLRADVSGAIHEIPGDARTPFAAVVWFSPTHSFELADGGALEDLWAEIDSHAPDPEASFAVRIDGRYSLVRARSVPRQAPPYRPLTEAVAEQEVFELRDVEGTMVGFRFPDHGAGIEVGGYHLHFVTDDRARGGHVLDCRAAGGLRVGIDLANDLHLELPPGVDIEAAHLDSELQAALELVEHNG